MLFDDVLPNTAARPGFRLERLQLLNWGTFDGTDGTIHTFEPKGRTALLVGGNGTGKSTLVDAILTLFVDSRTRNYNVAAGANKTERNLKSYIKGAFDRTATSDEASVSGRTTEVRYLRPDGQHLTALLAVFFDEELQETWTVLQVLFLKGDGSEDKIYAFADADFELSAVLAGVTSSSKVRDHLTAQDFRTTRQYSEYQRWITKRTSMRGKAIDMFNQTVAVKNILSLNDFVRSHMLEPFAWRDHVKSLLTHFDDLRKAHAELVRARQAKELLEPIEDRGRRYLQCAEKVRLVREQRDASNVYFADRRVRLLEPQLARRLEERTTLESTVARLDKELAQKRDEERRLKNDIEAAGGDRLKRLPDLITNAQLLFEEKQRASLRFHEQLAACGVHRRVETLKRFEDTRTTVDQIIEDSLRESEELTATYEDQIGRRAAIGVTLTEKQQELAALEKRRTNLPSWAVAVRERMLQELSLQERDLPYAAELIAVNAEESQWQPSLELVLRSFGLSLLVPDRHYRRVAAFIDETRLVDRHGRGQRLDYIHVERPVDQQSSQDGDRRDSRLLLNKLAFRDGHDLVPWVRDEVQRRFPYICCETPAEFQAASKYAMTVNRHIKFQTGRHRKDDQDRAIDPTQFVLGWNNAEKKIALAAAIASLESQYAEITQQVDASKKQRDAVLAIKSAAEAAASVTDFDAVDVLRYGKSVTDLRNELTELENSNDERRQLKKQLSVVEAEVGRLDQDKTESIRRIGQLETEIQTGQLLLDTNRRIVESSQESGQWAVWQDAFQQLDKRIQISGEEISDIESAKRAWDEENRATLDRLTERTDNAADSLRRTMNQYLTKFAEHGVDLVAEPDSLAGFQAILDELRTEGLPEYEERFRVRLREEVTREISLFRTNLQEASKEIAREIEKLNVSLAQVPYTDETIMQLVPKPARDREIDDFCKALSACQDDSLIDDDAADESRYKRIAAVIERLADDDKRTWRDKVLDIRRWHNFTANELDRDTHELRSSYDGSSGQSGGEKAKLAFTILVAALAYQFDIDPKSPKKGRFHFVVVDEMFSKVDDANAEYALKLFEQFGLQLLIVAPLDAKARVTEPFVDRFAHTVKDAATSKSRLFSVTAQEYEELIEPFAGDVRTNARSTRQLPLK